MDIGGRCISTIAKVLNCSRTFVKKCYEIVKNNLTVISLKANSGRKKYEDNHPEIIEQIQAIGCQLFTFLSDSA